MNVLQRCLCAALLALCLVGSSASATPLGDQVRMHFHAWQFDDARADLASLEGASPESTETLFLKGRMAFYEGRYEESVVLIDQAMANAPAHEAVRMGSLRQLVADTAEVTKGYVVARSPNGRFEVRYPGGKDSVLEPFAFEALEAAYDAMKEDFGVEPPTPVRVEVYPSAIDLAKVSPLTVEDIETSGTIALCKYNRLMITSPKALARGYGWVDTLTHEYVHMIVNIAGKGNVPIWLHEGLAKFSERRWRGGDDQRRISPYSEHLLHKRANEGKIVTFDQMHPSMAKLPSQEETAMAFAEVYAAMELIHHRHGVSGLRRLVDLVGTGEEVKAALAAVTEAPFEAFLSDWRRHLTDRDRSYKGEEPPDIYEQISFKKRASVGDPDDIELIPEDQAKHHIHLGELLRTKKRHKAAVVEYRRAGRVLGHTNPILQARLGRVLLDMGEVELSISEMRKALDDGEEYGALYVYLGQALTESEDWEKARAMLFEAAAINPFNPAIHRSLARVYDHLGQHDRALLARAHVTLLSAQ